MQFTTIMIYYSVNGIEFFLFITIFYLIDINTDYISIIKNHLSLLLLTFDNGLMIVVFNIFRWKVLEREVNLIKCYCA